MLYGAIFQYGGASSKDGKVEIWKDHVKIYKIAYLLSKLPQNFPGNLYHSIRNKKKDM